MPLASIPPVLTVTLNPAIDLHLSVEAWPRGDFARAKDARRAPGGKGVNISRVLAELGITSTAFCLLGGPDGAVFASLLAGAPFEVASHPVAGPTRTNVTITFEKDGRQVKVNQPGPRVTRAEARGVEAALTALMQGRRWVVFSGALPPGMEAGAYAKLVRLARRAGARVALDCAGESLMKALAARPDVIKPNRAEMADSLGRPCRTRGEALACAHEMIRRGAGLVVASHGGGECLAVTRGAAWSARPPKVDAFIDPREGPPSPMGAGDSLLAGVIAGLLAEDSVEAALRRGVACGAACAAAPDTVLARRGLVEQIRPQVRVNEFTKSMKESS